MFRTFNWAFELTVGNLYAILGSKKRVRDEEEQEAKNVCDQFVNDVPVLI